jgi:thymidylate synthase (FAD)
MSAVSLTSVTPDAEKTILFIARVSSNQENESTGLINYLIRNGHWSPFEHASMTLEIRTSRAIATQILRHRSFTFQEFSQRYAEVQNYIVYAGRAKGSTNRQGSVDDLDEKNQEWWIKKQQQVAQFAFDAYKEALDRNIAPECARFVLPLSTETKLYMTGTLRSWIHYLGEGPGGRNNPHTQFEHKELAQEARSIFVEQFPIISKALGWTDD